MDWRHRSACLDEDPELFFPIGNTGPAILQIEEAKQVCRRCEVREQCLAVGARGRAGPRRLGRPERGRAPRPQAPQRPRASPHRLAGRTRRDGVGRTPRRAVRRCRARPAAGRSPQSVDRGPRAAPAGRPQRRAGRPARTRPACARSTAPGCSTPSRSKPAGSPRAVVVDGDAQPARQPAARSPRSVPPASRRRRRVAVLDGVLQQLGQHHRQRGRGLRGQHAEGALAAHPHARRPASPPRPPSARAGRRSRRSRRSPRPPG